MLCSLAATMGVVKRATTIRHLVEMAEVATERMRLRETDIGWPLEEMWVTSELLGFAQTLEVGAVVLVSTCPPRTCRGWSSSPPANGWAISYGSANGRFGGATGP